MSEALGGTLVCCGSVSLQEILGLELGREAVQVVETPEGMEADQLGVEAALSLLEDSELDLEHEHDT